MIKQEEILAMHVQGIPHKVKDAIISAMNEFASRSVLEYAQQNSDAIEFAKWLSKGKFWKSNQDNKVWYQWEGLEAVSDPFTIEELYNEFFKNTTI